MPNQAFNDFNNVISFELFCLCRHGSGRSGLLFSIKSFLRILRNANFQEWCCPCGHDNGRSRLLSSITASGVLGMSILENLFGLAGMPLVARGFCA